MKAFLNPIFFCICYLSLNTLQAQSSIQQTEIEVDITQSNSIIAIHTIKKGETLYSIARFYKVPLKDLMSANNIQPEQIISLYSDIKIPISVDFIDKSGIKANPNWIPVIYTVKKKETLYTIGKKYFSQDIEDLNKRNDINSFIIHEDEKLIVGWWAKPYQQSPIETAISDNTPHKEKTINSDYTSNIDKPEDKSLTIKEKAIQISKSTNEKKPIPKSQLTPVEQLYTTSQPHLTKIYNQEGREYITIDSSRLVPSSLIVESIEETKTRVNRKGICLWMKDDPETTQLLAFHKSAEVGSTINVSYPLTNRSVDVLVVDNIKPNLYPDDVQIIVTKAVAQQLGARDSRIQINMGYYQ
ncbi:LysM peptidoglycan-binding domain-containing protein [Saprospiraceae bacterium]|nr:LysM peptidoglycan-binding domain-containing protein [Saprospiraceae bacterium]